MPWNSGLSDTSSRQRPSHKVLKPSNRIFLLLVAGIPDSFQWQDFKDKIRAIVGECIRSSDVFRSENDRTSFGMITIKDEQQANLAYEKLSLEGFCGRSISVTLMLQNNKSRDYDRVRGPTQSPFPPPAVGPRPKYPGPLQYSAAISKSPVSTIVYQSTQYQRPFMRSITPPDYQTATSHGDLLILTPADLRRIMGMALGNAHAPMSLPSAHLVDYERHNAALAVQVPILTTGSLTSNISRTHNAAVYDRHAPSTAAMANYQPPLIRAPRSAINPDRHRPVPPRPSHHQHLTLATPTNRSVFITGLPYDITDSQLRNVLKRYGTIETCRVHIDNQKNRGKGFATATFASSQQAEVAVRDLDGRKLHDRTVSCRWDKEAAEGVVVRQRDGKSGGASDAGTNARRRVERREARHADRNEKCKVKARQEDDERAYHGPLVVNGARGSRRRSYSDDDSGSDKSSSYESDDTGARLATRRMNNIRLGAAD